MTGPGSAGAEAPIVPIGLSRPPDENTDAPDVPVDEHENPADLRAVGWPDYGFEEVAFPGSGPQLDEGTT